MKASIIYQKQHISLGYKLIIVIALFFSIQISAQQKFTILQSNGTCQQIPVNGLKLTFDNNSSFTCWRNGIKKDMNFTSVGKIYFTDISIPTGIHENSPVIEGLKVYPNPSIGIITLEFNTNPKNKMDVSVSNQVGTEIFRKKLNSATKYQIDLSNQKSGIYFLKIYIDNQQYLNKLVVSKQ